MPRSSDELRLHARPCEAHVHVAFDSDTCLGQLLMQLLFLSGYPVSYHVEDSVIDNMNSLSRDTNSALPLTWRMSFRPTPTQREQRLLIR
jgi:hypothetical protein